MFFGGFFMFRSCFVDAKICNASNQKSRVCIYVIRVIHDKGITTKRNKMFSGK